MKKRKSFTLIEILIVSVVIAILTSVTVVFFRPNRERVDLVLSAHQLAQDIRSVEDMALSGKKLPSGNIPHGYGIRVYDKNDSNYPNKYIIFGDIDGSNNYNSGDEMIRGPISLGKGIEIYSLSPNSPLDIVVVPPSPDIYVNDSSNDGTITLSLKSDTSEMIKIIVNSKGLIEIQ